MRKTSRTAVLLIVTLAFFQITHFPSIPILGFEFERSFNWVEFAAGNPPNFTMTVYPLSQTVRIGEQATYQITLNSTNGFAGQVSLQNENFPQELLSEFNPAIIDLKSNKLVNSTLTINTISVGEAAFYQFTILATSGSITQKVGASLTVLAENDPLSAVSYAFLAAVIVFTALIIWYGLRDRRLQRQSDGEIQEQPRPPPV